MQFPCHIKARGKKGDDQLKYNLETIDHVQADFYVLTGDFDLEEEKYNSQEVDSRRESIKAHGYVRKSDRMFVKGPKNARVDIDQKDIQLKNTKDSSLPSIRAFEGASNLQPVEATLSYTQL